MLSAIQISKKFKDRTRLHVNLKKERAMQLLVGVVQEKLLF